jgi:hypothetical protein
VVDEVVLLVECVVGLYEGLCSGLGLVGIGLSIMGEISDWVLRGWPDVFDWKYVRRGTG